MNTVLIPVILSGGAGTRLWPVSREAHPKPFMVLPDGETLLQKTLARACALPGVTRTLTVTNEQYYFHSRDLYQAVAEAAPAGETRPCHEFLLEPCGRNTGPAIALAAHWALGRDKDAVLLVLPADHLIADGAGFADSVRDACMLAERGALVTFGVPASRPETGFGYIEAGAALEGCGFATQRFVEKPDLATAEAYLAQGGFYWNAGMFCFRADTLLDALAEHAPELAASAAALWQATDTDSPPVRFSAAGFAALPDISIDYALMEKTDNAAVVPARFDWSDIGAWGAMSELSAPDAAGNRHMAASDPIFIDSRDCYVHGEGRVIATVGLDGIMVVDTADALLVVHRDQAQNVREVVRQLKASAHPTHDIHRTVHRPWGTFTVLEAGERFKLKRIVVKPGAGLSLQMHHHRSEHWVVVSGTATVINGDHETLVQANQSTYIPAGIRHRLVNPGVIDCVMIEVQVGDYVGEDDIVRLEDSYGRT